MSWFSLVRRDKLALADDVSRDRLQQFHAVQPWLQIERRVERIDDEMIVMDFAQWRRRTSIERTPEARHTLDGAGNFRRHRHVRLERHVLRQPLRRRRNLVDHPVPRRWRGVRAWTLCDP